MGVMDRYNEKRKKKQDTSSNENSSGGVRERYEINKYFSSFPVDSVDQKYIDTFISDATNFFSSAEKSYSSLGYSNSSETYDTISNSWKDLDTRRNTIRAWLYKNRSNIDEETYNNVSKSLDSFNNDAQSIISSFEKALNEYSQFETEDAYNEYYNRYAKYGELSNTAEAATGWEKYLADVETSKQTAEAEKENEKWYEKIGRYLYGSGGTGTADTSLPTSNVSVAVGALREDDSHARPQENWTEEQKKVFGALYSSNPSEAYEYAIYTNSLNAKTAEVEQIKKIQESATSSFGAGFGNTIGAIVTAPLGLADYLNDLAYANAGRDIAPDGIVSPFEYSQSVTGGISSHLNTEYGTLDEDIPIFGGKGVGDIYGLGTSIAQSALSAYTLGGTGTLVSYFGQGAASGMDEALSRGATETQAILYGTAVGVFEGLAEQIGIDNLFKLGSSSTVKGFIKNILKQAGAEGAEEGLTSLLSNIADNVIMQDKSNFNILVEQYMKQGISESEAKKKAWMDSFGGIAFDTIAGAVSGAVHAAPHTAIQNIKENKSANKIYGDSTADLVSEALDIDPNNKYAQKMQNRLNNGKNLSGGQINRLVEANETAMYNQDVSAIQNAAKERLTALGETGDIEAISKALAKQAQGKKLTPFESQAIKNSKYGQRVANELNTKNIKSGQYSSAWAEQIGTNRINAEEYSRALADAETATKVTQTVESSSPTPQGSPQQAEKVTAIENVPIEENATESEFEASDNAHESEETESTVSLEEASQKYGAQAQAMIHTYTEGQDVAKYDKAYETAYNMGMSGVSLSYAKNSDSTAYLTEAQKELAYEAGKAAADTTAKEQDNKNKSLANGKTERKKGTVKGEGVTISDLKKTFNDTQNKAYKLLSTYAEATGIDIVLYKSETNEDGDFEGSQGKFKWSEDKIYIDINAGLTNIKDVNDLAKYTMLRTFSHEFTHFIEKWNPIWYNEFRKVVFDTLTERGENVHDLIETKMSMNEGMTYDKASREVVAEAMTDILPDANFVETLATKHKNIFDKLLDKLKEFLADLKAYFKAIGHNSSKEANALKEQVEGAVHYVDNIVKLFDKVALEAVEYYQSTVALEETTEQIYNNETPIYDVHATLDSLIDDSSAEEILAGRAKAKNEYKVTDDEAFSIDAYVRGSAYDISRLQRLGEEAEWSEYDTLLVDQIKSGLLKLPKYSGRTYRNLQFDSVFNTETDYDNFISDHAVGKEVTLKAFSSASKNPNGYPIVGDKIIHLVIDGVSARDISETFNIGQEEVIYLPGTKYKIVKTTTANDGHLLIYGEEIVSNEIQELSGGAESTELQRSNAAVSEGQGDDIRRVDRLEGKQESRSGSSETQNERSDSVHIEKSKELHEEVSNTDNKTSSEKLADSLLTGYINEENINRIGKALTSKELYALADEAFGGTQAEGAYNRKDAYDAMELAVNKFLLEYAKRAHKSFNGTAKSAVNTVEFMQDMLELLPTQNVRTQEMEDFQQFSTPPNIAYLAAWAANINASDFVLEPSAGIGGLAVFAKAWGAEVAVNELSKRRLEVLRAMGFDHLFNENAEQIDNILPDSISPSVVIMNPPFSSTAGRTAKNKTSNAEKHIDQALARLRDGGRLVAVLGKSMNNNDYYSYWDKLRKKFNIRANLSIDGNNYKKYGTTWGVQIVVIDKTGPQIGETITGRFTDLTQVPNILEVIRNDRISVEENRSASGGNRERESLSDGGNKQSDTGHKGVSERSLGNTTDTKRTKNRKSSDGNQKSTDRANRKSLAENSSQEVASKDGGRNRDVGRADIGDGDGTVKPNISDRPQSELSSSQLNETEEVNDDGVYATFVAPDIPIKGGKKHPAVLVESAAMAAVSMPKATYKIKLPADVINNNLSDAQLVTVTYAGQAHEQKLPDGRRKGFFVGDGTGVGKGRQIAGIILDNFMQGRKKAVWISKNNDLYGDAIRDWTATTGRSKDEVISHNKIKSKDKISIKEGILYSTYDTLKSEKGGNRLEQIVEWLGEDFDGVIAFDEAHNMGNLFGKKGKFGKSKGSEKARAGVELQRRLPNARIVYVSATAATEVDNLAYAERIGLWGQGTAFTNAQDFISKIGSSGLAAMELVIRDMKAMGTYIARSISYNGVNYDTVEHALDPMQTEIYNTMSRAWQKTMSNVQTALETTGGKYNSTERQRALGNFYSGMQRFYNQVLTSMSMPSVIADMRRELDAGHSCVLQIVNTNEAQQNKQLAEAKANGESLDNLDLTPREALIGYLMTSFPTQMFEEYTDEDGNLRSRPVMDSAGNPVQNKEAIRQRDSLVAEVNQMSIPDGPLEMLFDAFGPDAVAENTGRSRRVVPKKMSDGSITRVEERRTLNHRTADVQAFQDGKKRILVFSDAGGTGKSYHADRTEKNQQLRIHYVLQPGWVASNAVQGFGRTHRSNEASAPIYKLVTTNIKGQKRFTSTIARRLDQLGALTKGQRDTGSGMFGAKDNLETDLAKDSLREFYHRLGKNLIEGVDGMKTLDRLGLKEKFTDEFGAFKVNENVARDISTFLNRILALEVDEQNIVFDAFISIYEMELEAAIQSGTLDTGMENVKADKIEVVDDKVIRKDENTGSETHYIQAKTYTKPKVVTTVAEMSKKRDGFVGIYKTENGSVRAVFRIADKTTEWGAIQKQFRIVSPNSGAKTSVWSEVTLQTKAEAIDRDEWQKSWDIEVSKVPEYNEDTLHMLTGALLPIWNSLPQEGNTKVKRLITNDGKAYLGRVIDKDLIDTVLNRFSVDRTKEVFTAQQVIDKAINNGVRFYLTNNRTEIYRSKVSGEWRLEIMQPYNTWFLKKTYPELIQERIQYRDRYFIPVGEKGIPILEKILNDNPVRSTADDTEQYQSRAYLNEQHQQRTNTLTDREVLEMAANEIKVSDLTQAENDALTIFQDRLSKLKDLQAERAEQGRLYKEQQFGEKVDRKAAEETLNRMHILDSQIKKATAEVLTVEEKEILNRVLKKARKVVEAQERQHGQEILNRWRDRRNNAAAIKKYRDRLRGDIDELSNWILKPDNKDIVKHVPDVLKNSVIPFLSSINFMSKRALKGGNATKADEAFMANLEKLNAALKTNIEINGLYSGYNDLPPNFMENLQNFINSTNALVKKQSGELVINLMTSAELKELSQVVRTLKKYIMQVNRFHYNAMYEHVYEAGENSIEHLQELGNAGNTSAASNFLLWQQIRPAYAFERFGDGGIAIYDGLRRGQAQLAFNTKEIQSFTEKTYTEKEVKAWENEIKTFRFGKDIVKMPVSYIMAFYELSKDPEALEHINGEGIRVATYTHKGKKISDTGHILTVGDFNQIISSLTDRQREVADSLQKYMATQGGKWGNYVSVARFGEELFTNPHYFPINSDGRHLQANADEHPSAAALYALLNMSFTKSRKEGANNRIVIYSIFDVFANHMASMAQYNAMALPILDALKWFNYQQVFVDDDGTKHIGDSVRERMDRAYGVPEETRPGKGKSGYAQDFVMNIIKAFNGTEAQGTPYDSLGLKSLHRYNVAQVAYNLRVVVQQPMAITRAAMLIDYSSILKGMKLKPSAIKKNIEEMQKYSGIAAWKSLGFYDVNISRGLTHIIKHDSNALDKITDVGMWGAEKADLLTWAAIWSAAKEEVIKKQHLTPESNGFYEAVTKLFEDIIYKTQVVDSVLTKNEFMRDKGAFARLVGSFMSEPTTNASMLIDAYDKYSLDIQRGMTKQQAWQKNGKMIGRRLYVYAVGALLLAAVQAAADALRDDEEYEEWYEKWLEAFGGNFIDELMPFNKLPILSDFYDLAKELLSIFGVDTYGNPPQSVFMQWYDSLIKGTEIIYDKISGTDTNYTWYGGIYKLLQAISGMAGLPMASATREIITIWNNTIGAMAPSLKVKTYESSELSQIRYAYEDGYLTAEEATAQLLEQGLVDTEDEAYFTIQGWEAGDGYSKYDKVFDAVRNGASIDEAMDELTSHGYSEEDVLSRVKSKIGEWYGNGEISKQQAINMLTKYFDMDSNEINATVSYWEFKNANPDVDVNIGWFEKYYSDVAYSGISLDEYVNYRNEVKDITGEDKKARRMDVINSLPITNAQKDALYYAEGWAESKLYEAPWH